MLIETLIRIITDNYITIFELVGLLVILSISVHISTRMRRQTATVVILLFLEILCREVELYTQSLTVFNLLRPLMTACIYTLYPLILTAMTQLTTDGGLTRKKLLLFLIPEFLAAPLYFTSQWTKLVCFFSPDNSYNGGPLAPLPYYVFALYYVGFVILTARHLHGSDRPVKRIMRYIVFGAGLGAVVQVLLVEDSGSREFSLLFTSSVVLYFLFLYINRSRLDPLTGLLNRQSYYLDMESERISAVVSVDMNDLKYYNDHNGHEAGDEALCAVAKVMREHSGPLATVYRVGGDEFILFYRGADRTHVEASIAAMEENMAKTPYVCAFGYAMKYEAGSMEELLTLADARMYEHKAKLKTKTAK